MQIINAFWEKENLGLEVSEIFILKGEDISNLTTKNLPSTLCYIKISAFDHKLVTDIANFGYSYCETQFTFSKSLAIFKKESRITSMVNSFDSILVKNSEQLSILLTEVRKGIFKTDRIALDPQFGIQTANFRYGNWITNIYSNNLAQIFLLKIRETGQYAGFFMNQIISKEMNILLGGIFEDFADRGIGQVFVYHALNQGLLCGAKVCKVKVSSNNPAMINLYLSSFGFQLRNSELVFKAIKNI